MPEQTGKPTGTILAFDFGEKRIGIAVGEAELRQAHPLTTLVGEASEQRFSAIAALIREWQPARLLVGRPLSVDGTAHAMTARCTRFANQLRGRFGLIVDYADERFSSLEAQERLRAAGHGARRTEKHLDAVAAQVILQNYLDGMAGNDHDHSPSLPGPSDDRQTDACN